MQPFILKIHVIVCAPAIENAQLRNLTFQPWTIIPSLCRPSFCLLLVIVISDNHAKWVNEVHEYVCICTYVFIHVEVRGQCRVFSSMLSILFIYFETEYLSGPGACPLTRVSGRWISWNLIYSPHPQHWDFPYSLPSLPLDGGVRSLNSVLMLI